MDSRTLNSYIISASKYFPAFAISSIKNELEAKSDDTIVALQSLEFKDPTIMLIVSIFLGSLGIDRIMIGDTGLGIAKLLTAGGCGIWTIIDWFLIQEATKQKNLEKFNASITLL